MYQSIDEGDQDMSAEQSREEKNKELIERLYLALNKSVLGIMEEFWTEDMAWYGPAGIGTLRGVKEFEEVLRRPAINAIPDKVARDEIRIAEGDYVGRAWLSACHPHRGLVWHSRQRKSNQAALHGFLARRRR